MCFVILLFRVTQCNVFDNVSKFKQQQRILTYMKTGVVCFKKSNVWYGHGLFPHFCDSNREVVQMQQEEKQWHQNHKLVWCCWERKNIRNFRFAQDSDRVLKCWITTVLRKTVWVKFSASPDVCTNQFLIEHFSWILKKCKKMHWINARWNKQKQQHQQGKVGKKHAHVQGVGEHL